MQREKSIFLGSKWNTEERGAEWSGELLSFEIHWCDRKLWIWKVQEETLTVLKDGKEEVKAETAILPERKQKREEDYELNKVRYFSNYQLRWCSDDYQEIINHELQPLPLRELLDTEEGSGSSITDNANIEIVPEGIIHFFFIWESIDL